jgi:hypothetical protein
VLRVEAEVGRRRAEEHLAELDPVLVGRKGRRAGQRRRSPAGGRFGSTTHPAVGRGKQGLELVAALVGRRPVVDVDRLRLEQADRNVAVAGDRRRRQLPALKRRRQIGDDDGREREVLAEEAPRRVDALRVGAPVGLRRSGEASVPFRFWLRGARSAFATAGNTHEAELSVLE